MPRKTALRRPAVICAVVCMLIVFTYIWVSAAAVATTPGANATHYDVLNTTVNASDAELRRAYRRVIRSYHPDKWQRLGARERAQAERRYVQARYSYAVLSGPQRCQYDRGIMNATSKQYLDCLIRMAEQRRAKCEFASAKGKRQSKSFEKEGRHGTTPAPQAQQQREAPATVPSGLILFKSAPTYYLKQSLDQIMVFAYYLSDLALAGLAALRGKAS